MRIACTCMTAQQSSHKNHEDSHKMDVPDQNLSLFVLFNNKIIKKMALRYQIQQVMTSASEKDGETLMEGENEELLENHQT